MARRLKSFHRMHRSLFAITAMSSIVAAGCGAPADAASNTAPLEVATPVEPEGAAWAVPALEAPAAAGDTGAAVDDAPFRFGFAFVIHAGDPMVVLGSSHTAAGHIAELVSADDAWVTVRRRPIAEMLLEDEARAWHGQRVVLHAAAGKRCEATVMEPWLVDRAERAEDDAEGEDVPRQTLVAAALVADADCGEAQYATPLTFPSRVYAPVDATKLPDAGARVQAAMTALRSLPQYVELQTEYRRGEWMSGDAPAQGSFEQHADAGSNASFFATPDGRRIVVASLWAGTGCGDFQANLTAAFEETASGLLLRTVELDSAEAPDLVIEHAGELSLLREEWAAVPQAGGTLDIRPPVFSCPC